MPSKFHKRLIAQLLFAIRLVLYIGLACPYIPASAQHTSKEPLETLISGSSFERGDKQNDYELHRYENVRVQGCKLQWMETSQAVQKGQQISLIVQNLDLPVARVDFKSVRLDDYNTGSLLSLTMIGMSMDIKAEVKTVYADSSEDRSKSFMTGYGFFFSDHEVAKKTFTALREKISSCRGTL